MWFKTRTGLICVEGTAEFLADRWHRPRIGKCAGVFAYQARHPETTEKRLFRAPVTLFNRKMYLGTDAAWGSPDYGVMVPWR